MLKLHETESWQSGNEQLSNNFDYLEKTQWKLNSLSRTDTKDWNQKYNTNNLGEPRLNRIIIIIIMSRVLGVTMDGFWFGDRIYWTLWYSAWLHFTVTVMRTHARTHARTHTVTSSLPLVGCDFAISCAFPNCYVSRLYLSTRLYGIAFQKTIPHF
jgi:hypothetical protein